ncbi:MAG: TIGR02281 family clan AA aspartic protease [Geminicoccaceae bacterium]
MTALATAAGIGALVLLLAWLFPDALDREDNLMNLVFYVALLAVVGSSILATFRQRWGEALKLAVIWILIALVLIAGYAMRHDLERAGHTVLAAVMPGYAIETAPGEAMLVMGEDGHFHARVDVDGTVLNMLVDTGASAVVLSAEDARRIGIDPGRLDFGVPVSTANGRAFAAALRLRRMELGPIALDNVRAMVMPEGALDGSLLGMSFLSRLRSHAFEGDRMILRQ